MRKTSLDMVYELAKRDQRVVFIGSDLGPDTLKTFQAMDTYNPDKTWKLTEDDWPEEDENQGGTE